MANLRSVLSTMAFAGAACLAAAPPPTRAYDVIVAGAGVGGVAAAIQAARLGARVALLEETDWIGGQMTAAGVSTMDEAGLNDRSGIYGEFLARLKVHYARRNKTLGTCYSGPRKICFEPSVGRAILHQMIDDVRGIGALDLRLRTRVASVLAESGRVTGVVLSTGGELRSHVLIDATEYGDILALSPARYRIGKYTGETADPSGCVQSITYTAIVRKYPKGVPAELQFRHPPPGYSQAVRDRFATFVPLDRDPKNFRCPPCSWAIHNRYRGVPDSSNPEDYDYDRPDRITKTGINLANDMPVTLDIFDRSKRKAVECRAKLVTLQFLYYMQRDLGQSQWSVADDEGYDTPYNREDNSCPEIPPEFKPIERRMPVMPYVRESRRLVGSFTFAGPQLQRGGFPVTSRLWFPSSIAVGDYPMDLHGCKGEENMETSLEYWTDVTTNPAVRYGAFQVPWEVFLPEKVDGLLAAEKNLSQSRLVNGATRLQPIAMLTGQAAGATAALAARLRLPPRQVPFVKVQIELLKAGSAVLSVPFVDIAWQSPYWPTTQLVAVHELMAPEHPHVFDTWGPLTRAALNRILARFSKDVRSQGDPDQPATVREFHRTVRAATGHPLPPRNEDTPISRGAAATTLARMLETRDYCHPPAGR